MKFQQLKEQLEIGEEVEEEEPEPEIPGGVNTTTSPEELPTGNPDETSGTGQVMGDQSEESIDPEGTYEDYDCLKPRDQDFDCHLLPIHFI